MTDEAQPARSASTQPTLQADFLKPALAKIQANLELLLGKSITIAPGEAAAVPGRALGTLVPPPCVVLGVRASGAIDAQLLCLLAQPLALAMSAMAQLKSEAAMIARLAAPSEMSPAERDGVKEAASFIVAALGDFAKDSTGGRIVLAPSEPRFIPGSGVDLLGGDEECAVIEGAVTIASAPPSKLLLVVPVSLARAWSAPDPKVASIFGANVVRNAPAPAPAQKASEESGASAEPSPTLWISGRETLGRAIQESVGGSLGLRGFATLPELLAALDSEPPPGLVVVEVPSGSEFQLDLVAALRRHPALAASRLIVALENATRRHVLRCGTLGILDVIPLGLEAAELRERLTNRARRLPAKTR